MPSHNTLGLSGTGKHPVLSIIRSNGVMLETILHRPSLISLNNDSGVCPRNLMVRCNCSFFTQLILDGEFSKVD